MPQPSPPDDALREQLTAYLDGELPDEELAAIEARLATDTRLRAQIQGLERAWNALDGLPRGAAPADFARTTIEMVAVEAQKEVVARTAALPKVQRRRGLAVAGVASAAFVLAFVLVRWAAMRPDRQLLADLPVICHVDALQEVGGVAFLRELPRVAPNLLGLADTEQIEQRARDWRLLADGDRRAKADWVARLGRGERADLRDAAERFRGGLPSGRRAAAAEAFAAINTADDRDALMHTTLRYESWLASQPASEQARLRQLGERARLEELRRLDRRAAATAARSLSPDDALALRAATLSLKGGPELTEMRRALSRFGRAIETVFGAAGRPPKQAAAAREFFEGIIDRQYEYPALAVTAAAAVADGRQPNWLRRLPDRSRRAVASEVEARDELRQAREKLRQAASRVWPAIEQKLLASMSDAGRQALQRAGGPDEQRRALARLVFRVARSTRAEIDLEAFFASDAVSDRERLRLLALPVDELQAELEQMYADRMGGAAAGELPPWVRDWGPRRGRGRPGERGAPGPLGERPRRRPEGDPGRLGEPAPLRDRRPGQAGSRSAD